MKKTALLLFAILLFCLTGCGGETLADGEFSVSANSNKSFPAANAVDGDIGTGWVSRKKASDTNFQIFNVDFGSKKSFRTITLDDSFPGGYTNKPPEYVQTEVTYNRGDVSSLVAGTSAANVVNGSADGNSWISEHNPTADSPEWIWISFRAPVKADKIKLDNEMNNSVFKIFSLYGTNGGIDPRDKASYSNPENYSLLAESSDNEETAFSVEFEGEKTLTDILLRIESQQNEGESAPAALDEIFFYQKTGEDYTETHQPVRFLFMGSNDGEVFEDICSENGNYEVIWTRTLDEAVTYRFIRYLVFEEEHNNFPSIGELSFS